jgi:3-methylcrotonyl-CoA carboxylase alpha subunit
VAKGKPARRIQKLLIANRGEIAARVLHACRAAGIRSVAVFSEADRNAPYLCMADQAISIGPGPAAESYIDMDRILAAARYTHADAIHPGYGFLSENAEFAARCSDAGVIFIGPPADVIRSLGDKAGAKSLARQVGVPVVPGYYGADQTDERMEAEAALLGPPLIIKATAGGGGRGMRVVHNLGQFPTMLGEARREALAAFASDAVLLERYLVRPRHIEVQIFGDASGRVFSLHERECSIQRRHQKLLEESPSPGLSSTVRAQITGAAVHIGQAAGYRSAGTVEFLLEEIGGKTRFYFLEVNTRLQVEHPVTEMRTGLDMVRLQFDVAEGRATPGLTARLPAIGHAIEVRICSEDPQQNFAPSLGTLALWIEPSGPGVRVDSGVARGCEVTPFYDPMLAKLIVHASTRALAIERLEAALAEFHAIGVTTNIPFLLSIVRDAAFKAGDTHIQFLDEHVDTWRPDKTVPDEVLLALAADALSPRRNARSGTSNGEESSFKPASLWQDAAAWRNV